MYEPEDETADSSPAVDEPRRTENKILASLPGWLKRLFRIGKLVNKRVKDDALENELFRGVGIQMELYQDLLRKVGGDREMVERLLDFEKQQNPLASRTDWLQSAAERWIRDN